MAEQTQEIMKAHWVEKQQLKMKLILGLGFFCLEEEVEEVDSAEAGTDLFKMPIIWSQSYFLFLLVTLF